VPQAVAGEIIDGSNRLDAGETAARNHECEHPLPARLADVTPQQEAVLLHHWPCGSLATRAKSLSPIICLFVARVPEYVAGNFAFAEVPTFRR
jgi:hypothetical protein